MSAVKANSPSFSYTTKRRERETIVFNIDDDEFHFTPPKTAATTLDLVAAEDDMDRVQIMFDWLGNGLPDEENELLIARLRDNDDGLDMDTLNELVGDLMSTATGRPT